MKKLLILFFLLATEFCMAQQTYKVTEGELQFINPKKGIVIKKGNTYFSLIIKTEIQNNLLVVGSNSKEITTADYNILVNDKSNVFAKSIDSNYNFNKLNTIKFTTFDDGDKITFYKLNPILFVSFRENLKEKNKLRFEDYFPFIKLVFGDKSILYTFRDDNLYFIPENGKIKNLSDSHYSDFKLTKLNISNKETALFKREFNNDASDFYFISSDKNGKKGVCDIFNTIVIKQQYDSIAIDQTIICKNKSGFDLYNYQYKKINLKSLKTFKDFGDHIQVIENNKNKNYNYLGKDYTKKDLVRFPIYDMSINVSEPKFFRLSVKNTNLKIEVIEDRMKDLNFSFLKAIHLNKNDSIREFYFTNLKKQLEREQYSYKDFEMFYKLKNGKYGFAPFQYLYNDENTEYYFKEIYAAYYLQYHNLDKIEVSKNEYFKFYKNNKIALYPLIKNFRYKKLGNFNGYYARFELPNGKKGWLSKDGIEYLDD